MSTLAHALALRGNIDRVHAVNQPTGAPTDRARCGRTVTVVDFDEARDWPACRDCYPGQRHARGAPDMIDVWDMCADLDARYNNTIRGLDRKPVGSIL